MKIDIKSVVQKAIINVRKCYDIEQEKLSEIGRKHKTEGEIRAAAGLLVEKILQSVFDAINGFLSGDKIISKVGSTDYLKKKVEYKGKLYINDSIQVDRHVLFGNRRIAFIENKTYLDTCYYDRALADFKKIVQALLQSCQDPQKCLFIVFAGQKAGRDNTFLTYEAEFWHETKELLHANEGIEPKTFFFLKGTRSSSKPLYRVKHELNEEAIASFVKLVLSVL